MKILVPQVRVRAAGALAMAVGLLAPSVAQAASLKSVSSWGASGVPSTASMYIYVPDNVATKPPILVLAHYCGGTASAVFGQAQNGGLVKAADQYGFIMLVPQTTNNCWDVGSTKSLTHDGGGEAQAVAQMVKYAITTYQANADRVYVTGDSSGAMMTEGMLAVYPEVFKGGASFAGVPAGCWAVGDPTGAWSSQCAGGQVTHTAQEWGDLVRGMYSGYSGHHPRVQLFHGDADATINYKNHTEAIKQWTNVLGLSTAPTTTDTVTLGSHQAKRERWQNSCGYVVLDAFTSMGGDHGPSDALFNASYVIPFMGLDQTGVTDPEIAKCGAAGMGGTAGAGGMSSGGRSGAGGAGAAGGNAMGGAAGATASGGVTGNGGAPAGGGGLGSGGQLAAGGMPNTGGITATGGTPATGGSSGSSGSVGVGGSTGGTLSGAGGSGTAGTTLATGGSSASPSGGSNAQGGSSVLGGKSGASPTPAPDTGGCACAVPGNRNNSPARALALALGAALLLRRRRAR